MNTLITLYLIVGCVNSLILSWCLFQDDYDEFVERTFQETPPTVFEKIGIVAMGIFLWPVHLYWILRS